VALVRRINPDPYDDDDVFEEEHTGVDRGLWRAAGRPAGRSTLRLDRARMRFGRKLPLVLRGYRVAGHHRVLD